MDILPSVPSSCSSSVDSSCWSSSISLSSSNLVCDSLVSVIDSSLFSRSLSSCSSMTSRLDLYLSTLSGGLCLCRCGFWGGLLRWWDGFYYRSVSLLDFELGIFSFLDSFGVVSSDVFRYGSRLVRHLYRTLEGRLLSESVGYLCFRNCVYDLGSGVCLPHSFDLCLFSYFDYDFTLGVHSHLWDSFLRDVLPDLSVRRVLQEFFGLLFINRRVHRFDKLLFLLGSGSNGKSVFFESILGCLGRVNVTNFELRDLFVGRERLSNIACVNGKLLNYSSDVSSSGISEGSFKSFVSGEPQQARFLYGRPFMAYDMPLLVANANSMPSTFDLSVGFFRRFLIIPFTVTISSDKQDKSLGFRLSSEYCGIMNWILEGRQMVIDNGYRLSDSLAVSDALYEYEFSEDSVHQWVVYYGLSGVSFSGSMKVDYLSSELYGFYRSWCSRSGNVSIGLSAFGRRMSILGFSRSRLSRGVVYHIHCTSSCGFSGRKVVLSNG